MRGGHDVPAHADEVHAAAEQGNEHRSEEITEAALLPEQGPIDLGNGSGGHGALQFTIGALLVREGSCGNVSSLRPNWLWLDEAAALVINRPAGAAESHMLFETIGIEENQYG